MDISIDLSYNLAMETISFIGINLDEKTQTICQQIADKKGNFFLTYNNQTVKDNLPLSFTLTGDDCIKCRRQINKTTTREYLPPLEGEKYPSQKLPLDQRWSARKFDFSQVFEALDIKSATKVKLEWFYVFLHLGQ